MPDVLPLFHRYKDDVYRLALSCTRSPQEAEDICQSVFLKLMEHPHITPGKEKAWLMQVTVNQCRSLLRSHWWSRTAPMDEKLPAPTAEGDGVREAVMALEPKYRVVIYLYYYEQYSVKEIAQLLRISPSNVSTRLFRAREMLKKRLEE